MSLTRLDGDAPIESKSDGTFNRGSSYMLIRLLNRLSRTVLLAGLAAFLLTISVGPNQAKAEMTVSATFYDQLSPDGYWVEDPYYGTVWYPSRSDRDWRPYSYGQWVWTSDYGWYWESDEPWGWATYHYGRWVYTVGLWLGVGARRRVGPGMGGVALRRRLRRLGAYAAGSHVAQQRRVLWQRRSGRAALSFQLDVRERGGLRECQPERPLPAGFA